jgi:hypothetical protein
MTTFSPAYYGPPDDFAPEVPTPVFSVACLAVLSRPGDVLPPRCHLSKGHAGEHQDSYQRVVWGSA